MVLFILFLLTTAFFIGTGIFIGHSIASVIEAFCNRWDSYDDGCNNDY